MQIAIVGTGAIGSTYAYQLSKAGHAVTVVARGKRLEMLQRDGAIVLRGGEHAPVRVLAALEPDVAYDLVLVTVLATQVEAVFPQLRASAARRVMFMFNTFASTDPLRDAVGEDRFLLGFPGGVFTLLREGRIDPQIRRGSVSADASLAEMLSEAGIPTAHERDMPSWLRTHAAMMAPLMAVGVLSHARQRGVTFAEATAHARALTAGLDAVEAVGNELRPALARSLRWLPRWMVACLLFLFSRTRISRDLGGLGDTESRMLIDMISEAAPALAPPLRAIRP